jgi:hypothetical protein
MVMTVEANSLEEAEAYVGDNITIPCIDRNVDINFPSYETDNLNQRVFYLHPASTHADDTLEDLFYGE